MNTQILSVELTLTGNYYDKLNQQYDIRIQSTIYDDEEEEEDQRNKTASSVWVWNQHRCHR